MKHIRSHEELTRKIKESIDIPLDINWIKTSDNWVGVFKTDKNEYRIVISKVKYDIWKYKYYIKTGNTMSVKMTNLSYDVFKVLSTVKKGAFDFLTEINPNGLIFGANNDSGNRVKFYSIFSMECKKEFKYKNIYDLPFGDDEIKPTLYVVYNDLTNEQLEEIITMVIGDEVN